MKTFSHKKRKEGAPRKQGESESIDGSLFQCERSRREDAEKERKRWEWRESRLYRVGKRKANLRGGDEILRKKGLETSDLRRKKKGKMQTGREVAERGQLLLALVK